MTINQQVAVAIGSRCIDVHNRWWRKTLIHGANTVALCAGCKPSDRVLYDDRLPIKCCADQHMDSCIFLGLLDQARGRWSEALAACDQAILLRNSYTISLISCRCSNVFERQDQHGAGSLGAIEDVMIKIRLLGTAQQSYEAMVLPCLANNRPAEK